MSRGNSKEDPAIQLDRGSLEQTIAELECLDYGALKARWNALHGTDPPKSLSRQLLTRALAYAIQEKVCGGLTPAVRQRLKRLGAELQATGRIASVGKRTPFKPGTRLIREWQGRTYEVTVLGDGFHWNGETYRSLSAIARSITGTRWNGQVFFGVKSRTRPQPQYGLRSDDSAGGTRELGTPASEQDRADDR